MRAKRKKRFNYLHIICVLLIALYVALTYRYLLNGFCRVVEACRDFGLSVAYYFCELFGIERNFEPTIMNYSDLSFLNGIFIPSKAEVIIPSDYDSFKSKWGIFWGLFVSKENFFGYIVTTGRLIVNICKILTIVIPVIYLIILALKRTLKKQNNRRNVDTKPLKVWKKIEKNVFIRFFNFVKSTLSFIGEHRVYYKIFVLIILVEFNFISIVIEFFAFYFYFVFSFDVIHIYRQLYKLFVDLIPMIKIVPIYVWIILALYVRKRMREKIALGRLMHFEYMNRGFINERPICMMVCGTMGKSKTTMITDISLSQEEMFRDKAKEILLENDLKFSFFPWINLENTMKRLMAKHIVYNLATIKRFMCRLEVCYKTAMIYPQYRKSMVRHLKKRYGIDYTNLIFDYDYARYGLEFDDKLKVVDIWEVISVYAKAYFIYSSQTSLMINNYSVRTDSTLMSIGNFPLWDGDFFARDSKDIDYVSKYAHILDFDSLRLGRKVITNNKYADSFEFGVVGLTEIGKERQNALELIDKKKNEEVANQKNDLFNYALKMIRHSATVDNFPFVKVIADEQRPESWGADARDLCDIVHIRERGETQLAMPFFTIEEILHSMVFSKFTNVYHDVRFNRSDNTLLMYLFKGIASKIHNYYKGTYNRFGYSELSVQTENGTQDGKFKNGIYYLMNKKIYSKRFSTDCFSDFFDRKSLRSRYGINDLPAYKTEKASLRELKSQNSYFIRDIEKHI